MSEKEFIPDEWHYLPDLPKDNANVHWQGGWGDMYGFYDGASFVDGEAGVYESPDEIECWRYI